MKFPGIHNPFQIFIVAFFSEPVHKNTIALIYTIVFYITKIAMLYDWMFPIIILNISSLAHMRQTAYAFQAQREYNKAR